MLPLLFALSIFFTDVIIAVVIYNVLIKRGHAMALPIAGFILLAGIVSAIMVWMYLPMALGNAG